MDVLNRAGMELLTAKQWDLTETVEIQAMPGEDIIRAPRGWTRIAAATGNNQDSCVRAVALRRIDELRAADPDLDVGVWYIAPDTAPANSPDTDPGLGLRIYPTPTVKGEPTLRMRGVQGWATFTSSNLDLKPSLPSQFHFALYLACMCTAIETHDPSAGPAPERGLLSQAIENLWSQDQDSFDDAGELLGGVDTMHTTVEQFRIDWGN